MSCENEMTAHNTPVGAGDEQSSAKYLDTSIADDLSIITPVTFPVASVTVISHDADEPPSAVVTVIVTTPAFMALTLPSVTVATVASLLVQINSVPATLTVAPRIISSPTIISATD